MSTVDRGSPASSRGSGFAYLAVLLVGGVVAQVVNVFAPGDETTGSPSLALALVIATVAASAVPWWRYQCTLRPTGSLRLFLGAILGLWLIAFIATASRGETASVTLFVLLLLWAALWLKPPSEHAALRAADVLGWALVGATVLTVALEALGVLPSIYDVAGRAELAAADREFYWLPLVDFLGLDARWAGPFVHPNLAGPVGAALLVFGLTRAGITRVVFCVVGAGILLLTGSRNSLVAAAAGVLVIVIAWWLRRPGPMSRWLRVLLAALPLAALLVLLYRRDPGFSGRTTVWPEFVRLWGSDRIFGVGEAGIVELIDAGVLPGWAFHAHNVALDTLVRYGIVGVVVMVVAFATALVIVWKPARSGRVAGLALVVTLIVGGFADTIFRWLYLSTPMAVLLLAVLMSSGLGGPADVADESQHQDDYGAVGRAE